MRLLEPLQYVTCTLTLGLRFARWTDAVPYPEWELVTDEEPEARDGGSAGTGVAAKMADTGPTRSEAAANLHAAGSGDAEQVRVVAATVCRR